MAEVTKLEVSNWPFTLLCGVNCAYVTACPACLLQGHTEMKLSDIEQNSELLWFAIKVKRLGTTTIDGVLVVA